MTIAIFRGVAFDREQLCERYFLERIDAEDL